MSDRGDIDARLQALDPHRSFIVQAPAGSGKTELLIQRYLRLLAGVREPEQIIAITFTRKAAAEMRTRILSALQDAAAPADDISAHRLQTRELARAALARDAELDWNIRSDPQRMRIGTLDSFNSALATHLPLLSGGTGGSEVRDDVAVCYRAAARQTVESIWQGTEDTKSRADVLTELDFDTAGAERLIANLLEVREQWIGWLFDVDAVIESTTTGIQTLRNLSASQVIALIDRATSAELLHLTKHAHSKGTQAIRQATSGVNSTEPADQLCAVASLFLTRDGQWRRRFTKSEGFAAEFTEEKARLKTLIDRLSSRSDLAVALDRLRALPEAGFDPAQRWLLTAATELMRRAVAELRLIFARERIVDFSELSLTARFALGEVDDPSELLLALDHRIQHILVDEFQDTSVAQSDMLETLTAGWEPNDGRTLFVVGDPMQSIYRFRNADMSLFLAARQFGIGNVACQPLQLSANFRSAPAIVDWVNGTFGQCFPEADDLMEGIARFSRGESAGESHAKDQVCLHALDSENLEDEHATVLHLIAGERRAHSESSIAILVRSRSHLAGFQALLREHGWQARAVEIDAPYTSQLTQDLLGLARALTHFGDRLAWLALLRAPCCGLQWSELEALVGDDPDISVWEAIHDEARLGALTGASRERVLALRAHLSHALTRRAQLSFVEWLEETWRCLGGHIAIPATDGEQLDELLGLFAQAAVDQDIADVADLESFFRKPLRQPDPGEAGIDIMTIHRAKGLEFDCVIVPGLARRPRGDERRLIEWFDAFDVDGKRMRIVAPLRRAESGLLNWIRARNRDRGRAEAARLLYVATTRARRRLHLVWGLEPERSPASATLLHAVWPILADTPIQASQPALNPPDTQLIAPLRRLRELPPAPRVRVADVPAEDSPQYEWTSGTAANVGIVVHEWLQTMCEQRHLVWNNDRVNTLRHTFASQLELLGVPPDELDQAQSNVVQSLLGILADARGRWIIGEREAAESEVMLSEIVGGLVVHQRLDRTFVDEGIRWIIDYKTSVCQDDDVTAFLDAEVTRYRAQLERYAQFMARHDPRPIRLGLYFPMLPAFREWPAPTS